MRMSPKEVKNYRPLAVGVDEMVYIEIRCSFIEVPPKFRLLAAITSADWRWGRGRGKSQKRGRKSQQPSKNPPKVTVMTAQNSSHFSTPTF